MSNHIIIRASISLTKINMRYALDNVVYNMISNQFILGQALYRPGIAPYEDILNSSEKAIASGLPFIWYAWKDGVQMKIIFERNSNEDWIFLEPIEPFKKKRGFGSEQELIDLGFYIQCCIEICDNFIVFDLKAGTL